MVISRNASSISGGIILYREWNYHPVLCGVFSTLDLIDASDRDIQESTFLNVSKARAISVPGLLAGVSLDSSVAEESRKGLKRDPDQSLNR